MLAAARRDILRDLFLSPARQSALAAESVRAGTETSQAGSETGEACLLLLRGLGLLQVEGREADGAVVRAALRLRCRAVGAGVGSIERHAVGDVDALVGAVAVLGLVGDVKPTGAS